MILCIMANKNVEKAKERLEKPLFANSKYLTDADFKDVEAVYFDESIKKSIVKYSENEKFKGIKFINIDVKVKEKKVKEK